MNTVIKNGRPDSSSAIRFFSVYLVIFTDDKTDYFFIKKKIQTARKINTITIAVTTFSNQGFSLFIKRGGMPIFAPLLLFFISLFLSDKTVSFGSIISFQFLNAKELVQKGLNG